MNLLEKLSVLADGAKYDASCASCGSTRSNNKGIGANSVAGICHTWTPDGRCVSLLKILLSNDCAYNCKYCFNRLENDHQRATFIPVRQDGVLPTDPLPPLKRENRLYQADWLIRVYKFNWKELLYPRILMLDIIHVCS